MKIYPDSVKGIYIIESKHFDFKLKKIIIFDENGNQVNTIEQPSEIQEIDLRNSPNGIYHVSAIFDQNEAPIRMKLFKK
jgi:hypothetical protein